MILEATGLGHRLGGRQIIDLPDLTIQPGEHLLLLGPSGSGKTTLINILSGLISPSSGSVRLNDAPFSELPPHQRDAARRRTIGLVFQTLRLVSALTVRQNLALAQQIVLGSSDSKDVDMLIASVGLDHRADAKPRTLSQGEGQRAAIARALSTRPALLIADEPTSALDDLNAEKMIDLLLGSAAANGATLVIATHDHRIRHRFPRTMMLAPAAEAIAA